VSARRDGVGGGWRARDLLARFVRAVRSNPFVSVQLAVLFALVAQVVWAGDWRILMQWGLFALHAIELPARLWAVDGPATLRLSLSYLGKLLLALAPTAMLIRCAPKWRIAGCVFGALTLAGSISFVRACPSFGHWVVLASLSALGVLLVRHPFGRWAVGLPLIVLLVVPASQHGSALGRGEDLVARCAANDGERPTNLQASQLVPRYYGIHFLPPDRILLTGETSEDGRFMNIPHGGQGSWWLRKSPEGRLAFAGRSQANGNVWTSCRLAGEIWFVRAGYFMEVQPPGADGPERVRPIPFPMVGFDAPDIACDDRTGTLYASDLLDGRLVEFSPRTGEQPHRRPDSVSVRGGLMSIREGDGRLVMLDFQDLVVYALDESRVVRTTPAAIASSSLALCQADGAVAVPDLAGRLRVFRMDDDGGYAFDWGLDLFAPRAAAFSPDCAFIGVTSADDRHVWVIDRGTRRVVKTFELGPAIRGAAFIGPRELAVADACTVSVLRF
jgi:hypothetical protein